MNVYLAVGACCLIQLAYNFNMPYIMLLHALGCTLHSVKHVVVVVVVVIIIIIIIIIIIRYGCLLSQAFLPGTSLEPAVIPTAQASSFTLQYFPYCV